MLEAPLLEFFWTSTSWVFGLRAARLGTVIQVTTNARPKVAHLTGNLHLSFWGAIDSDQPFLTVSLIVV
jgi:hypothetical protein